MTVSTFPPIAAPTRRVRAGFSFVELMFAVVILGIGFILLAAVFPVGLSQAKSTFDESVAASVGRGAAAYLEKIANNATLDPTNEFIPLQLEPGGEGNIAAQQNMIQASDPRYAWVCLYRRPIIDATTTPVTGARVAQVIFFITQSGSAYTQADFAGLFPERQLAPRAVRVDINRTGTDPYLVTVKNPASGEANLGAAAPGAFLVIANDNVTTPAPNATGRINGRIFRLGNPTGVANQYAFAPGYEYNGDPDPDGNPPSPNPNNLGLATDIGNLTDATAYIIGRTRTGPSSYENVAQDVAIYTTFIDVK